MKYKHGEIQVGTVMIGASHVYFVKTVDTSDCAQVQTCAQSDVLAKHGGMEVGTVMIGASLVCY